MCTVHTNRNSFQTVHQKCVLCTETEHFPDGTHKAVVRDHTRHLRTKLADIQSLKYTNLCDLHQLKVIHQLHVGGTNICMAFILCYLRILVLRMVADVRQEMNHIECGIEMFNARQVVSYVAAYIRVIIFSNNSLLPLTVGLQYKHRPHCRPPKKRSEVTIGSCWTK
jgi:hypothetical protein